MPFLEIIMLLGAGLVGGFVGAQVGGGGLIILPMMLWAGLSPIEAIGVVTFSGLFGNGMAAITFWKTHRPNLRVVIPMGLAGALGSALGAYIINTMSRAALGHVMAWLLVIPLALVMLDKSSLRRYAFFSKHDSLFGFGAALCAGVYSGMMSVSATTLYIILFVLFFSRSYVQAAADAAVVSVLFACATLVVFISFGTINVYAGIPVAIGAIMGSAAGARTATHIGDQWLKIGLIVMTAVSFLKLIFA